jgi:hypothetical protein
MIGGMLVGQDGGDNPLAIAGCVLWLRADLGVTHLIGVAVSQWNDQSGSGDANRNFAQTTVIQQPTLNASDPAFNNQASISFLASATQFLNTPGAWNSSAYPYTVFMVLKETNTSNNDSFLSSTNSAPAFGNNAGISYSITNDGSTISTGLPAMTVGPNIFRIEFNTTSGLSKNSITPQMTGTGAGTRMVGLDGNMFIGDTFTGSVAEVIIYNSILSTANKTVLMNNLGIRYGIAIGA